VNALPKNSGLLFALVLLILVQPIVPAAWVLFLYIAAMAGAVWLLAGTRVITRAALSTLAIPCLIAVSLPGARADSAGAMHWNVLELTVAVAIAFFLLYACYVLLRALLRARTVSGEIILGAVNLYIVFGLMWSLLYAIHEWAIPGSFHVPPPSGQEALYPNSSTSLSTFTYYSFVTQATQGYGDIFPRHPFARTLVILHTIIGQFYMAIVVAFFLGIYIAECSERVER
jgi:hypothetical protein